MFEICVHRHKMDRPRSV